MFNSFVELNENCGISDRYFKNKNLGWFSPKLSSKDTSLNAFLCVLYSQFAHVCFALLTAGVVVGAWEAADQTQPTKPNNESSRSERGFIHFIFLWLDSALDRGRVPIWSPQ